MSHSIPSKSFVLWTDASSFKDKTVEGKHMKYGATVSGYVIKCDYCPDAPMIVGSKLYDAEHPLVLDLPDSKDQEKTVQKKYKNIYNSMGEIAASVEGLREIYDYCMAADIDPKQFRVNVKTDFNYLVKAIRGEISVDPMNERKVNIVRQLNDYMSKFDKVTCDEVFDTRNLAHNVCAFEKMEYLGIKNRGHTRKNFHVIRPEKFKKIFRKPGFGNKPGMKSTQKTVAYL